MRSGVCIQPIPENIKKPLFSNYITIILLICRRSCIYSGRQKTYAVRLFLPIANNSRLLNLTIKAGCGPCNPLWKWGLSPISTRYRLGLAITLPTSIFEHKANNFMTLLGSTQHFQSIVTAIL